MYGTDMTRHGLVGRIRGSEAAELNRMVKELDRDGSMDMRQTERVARYVRVYRSGAARSRIYHVKLSTHDTAACGTCGARAAFYCNMNDAYFCEVHVVGHDENEL